MLKKNTIYCGDNLDILKGMDDNSVDLCYIDPPFFTSKQYEVIWGDNAEKRAFDDRWVSMGDGRYTKDINVYLNFMEPRLREIQRVLKPTGSFYLHCDDNASHYLKVLIDQIFGYGHFINEIIWKRSANRSGMNKIYKREHDSLLFYVKGDKYTYNMQFKEIGKNTLKNYRYTDTRGQYRLVPLMVSGITENGETGKEWMGVDPKNKENLECIGYVS
jgi:DNA modification methylase